MSLAPGFQQREGRAEQRCNIGWVTTSYRQPATSLGTVRSETTDDGVPTWRDGPNSISHISLSCFGGYQKVQRRAVVPEVETGLG